jgi:stage II sporulation protein D
MVRILTIFIVVAAVFGLLSLPGWASMPVRVKVQLFQAHPEIHRVYLRGAFQVLKPVQQALPGGNYQLTVKQGQLRLSQHNSQSPWVQAERILIQPAKSSVLLQPDSARARRYSGILEFNVDTGGKIAIRNEIPARTYVAIVVSSETLPGWPLEALKAQAVLTQSGLSRYQAGDVLGDSTQREVYLGQAHWRPEVARAVNSVWGQVLTYNERPVTPFYHASCGGHTSDGRLMGSRNSALWLRGVRCPYCRNAPFAKPTRTVIPKTTFAKYFSGPPLAILHTDPAGRPLLMKLGNHDPVSGYDFWIRLGQRLGWDKAPGTRFSLVQLADGNIQISSTGAGHGLGLCQWGAAEMARQGKLYADILRFYFPKVSLSKPLQ